MFKNSLILGFLLFSLTVDGQSLNLDSLRNLLKTTENDSLKVEVLVELTDALKFSKPAQALNYGYEAISQSRNINLPRAEAEALAYLTVMYISIGDLVKAKQMADNGIDLAKQHQIRDWYAVNLNERSRIYRRTGEFKNSIEGHKDSFEICDSIGDFHFSSISRSWLSLAYLENNQIDSARYYASQALKLGHSIHSSFAESLAKWSMGMIEYHLGNMENAISWLKQTKLRNFFDPSLDLAKIYLDLNQLDSSRVYANRALQTAIQNGFYLKLINCYDFLTHFYQDQPSTALLYSVKSNAIKDSLFSLSQSSAFESFLEYEKQQSQLKIEEAQKDFKYRIRTNIFLGSSFTLLVIALLLYLNNQQKKRSKRKIEIAYERLKNTQSQLVHSEKMASLGELTAGIAHEIQNPLNFVNNFSEVNKELFDELESEIEKGDKNEIASILKDLRDNEEKVIQHGKRADTIVKSMLQHSRTSSGEKELTDINALCDEYLRLAYHGLRAKDKTFNATFKTELDPDLPKIKAVPQDIGRVLLNLINNAFQACTERSRSTHLTETTDGETNYRPEVIVATKKLENTIEITVSDNGPGIPEEIRDKIFQPFFTTKPAGQGTGLGLSLAYDIVKAHGGDLRVESEEGKGTKFSIFILD